MFARKTNAKADYSKRSNTPAIVETASVDKILRNAPHYLSVNARDVFTAQYHTVLRTDGRTRQLAGPAHAHSRHIVHRVITSP